MIVGKKKLLAILESRHHHIYDFVVALRFFSYSTCTGVSSIPIKAPNSTVMHGFAFAGITISNGA